MMGWCNCNHARVCKHQQQQQEDSESELEIEDIFEPEDLMNTEESTTVCMEPTTFERLWHQQMQSNGSKAWHHQMQSGSSRPWMRSLLP